MLVLLATVVASSTILATTLAQGSYGVQGTCSGAGANPLVYNFEVNGYPAKVFRDGMTTSPIEGGFFVEEPDVITRALRRRFLDTSEIPLEFNILYIDMDGEGVLFDSGNGPAGAIASGVLFDLLEGEGISREDITHVMLTHGHPDHIQGLVTDMESLESSYPNAQLHVSRVDYEYWTAEASEIDPGPGSLLPDELFEIFVSVAQSVFGAVQSQIEVFEIGEEVMPGITTIASEWHTPGSVSFSITDGDSNLVFVGDSVTHKVSIENPWVSFVPDFAPVAGPAGRYELLDMVVKEQWQILSYHAKFPGLFFVDNQGVNFQTTAAEYEGSTNAMAVCV